MSQLQIDESTGELVRTNGQLVRVSGEDEVLQHVRIRLRLFREEVPLNLSLGMQYVGIIFKAGSTESAIEGEFRSQILETPGVSSITDLDMDLDAATRVLSVDWSGTIDVAELRDQLPVADAFTVAT